MQVALGKTSFHSLKARLVVTTIDFTALDYISSAGLAVLLKTQKRLMQSGDGLKFVNVNRHIFDILRYSGFDKIFEIEAAG